MTAEQIIEANGYLNPRRLPTGEWAAISIFMFTAGILVGIDEVGYRTRFCYHRLADAQKALAEWDGTGDPPGPWIKEKGRAGERSNPMAAEAT